MQCFSIKSQNVTKNVAKNDTAKNVAKNNVAKNDIAKNVAIAWLFWGCCWAHHLAISGLLLGVVLGPCLDAFLGLSWPFCWDVGMSEGQKVGTSGFQGCCFGCHWMGCLAIPGLSLGAVLGLHLGVLLVELLGLSLLFHWLECCVVVDGNGNVVQLSRANPKKLLIIRHCITHLNVARKKGHHFFVTQLPMTCGC